MRGESLFHVHIKLAGAGVTLNGGVELRGVEGLVPRAKPRQFGRSKLFDGFLDVFRSGLVRNMAFAGAVAKGGGRVSRRRNPPPF